MKFSNLFGRRVNRVFVIGIKNSTIPYPESDVRWETYGSPLSLIFDSYFDEIGLEWFQDDAGNLACINVFCYKSKFKCKQSEDGEVNAKLFRVFDNAVKSFFEEFGAEAEIIDVYLPSATSFIQYAAERTLDKIRSSEENAGLQSDEGTSSGAAFKPALITTVDGKEKLIVNLNIKLDPSDVEAGSMTLQRSEDGRYLVGYISKSSGERCYFEVPENVAEEILGNN